MIGKSKPKKANDEVLEVIRNMYNAGETLETIGKKVGMGRDHIGLLCRRMREAGMLKERKPIRTNKNCENPVVTERRNKIRDLALAGMQTSEIAEELSLKVSTIREYIREMKKEGLSLPQKKFETESRNHSLFKYAPSTLSEGDYVRCTRAVSATCVYGTIAKSPEDLCRYSRVTGKCRSLGEDGCSWKHCTKYSRVSKSNPKLTSQFD